ncbi:MAG TPA: hypothetical protein VFY69_03510 [Solirubrobacterales bacterium]|nr:hypothetical protein [Solirubrobacterales bacterium]
MSYIKKIGLVTVATTALMVFAGTASATVTYNGSAYTGEISATSTNFEMDGTIDVKCSHSVIAGSTTGGATSYSLSTLTFSECGGDTVTVVNPGTLTYSNNTDTKVILATGSHVTVQVHRWIFGFPVTTHCTYATNNTAVGHMTNGEAKYKLYGANIPQKPTDSACGENTQWTGEYTIINPGALTVD